MEKQRKYSLKWSVGVYQAFKKSMMRATIKINEIYQIDDEMPPVWIASGLIRWRNYKKIVKTYNRWIASGVEPFNAFTIDIFKGHIGNMKSLNSKKSDYF